MKAQVQSTYPFTENLQGQRRRDVRVPARIHPRPWDEWEGHRGHGGWLGESRGRGSGVMSCSFNYSRWRMRAGGGCTDWTGSSFDIPFGVLVNEWMVLCARWIGYQATGRCTGSADGYLTHQAVAQKTEHPPSQPSLLHARRVSACLSLWIPSLGHAVSGQMLVRASRSGGGG